MAPHLHDLWPFIPEWIPVKSYGFFIALGFLLAAWMAYKRANRVGLSGDAVLDLALWAVVSGVVGARVFYVVQFYGEFFRSEPIWKWFAFHQGGLVFYGGFLGALPVCAWIIKRRKLPLAKTLDVLASVVLIGLAFGRIGCFSFGCCWGAPTEHAFGWVYPADAPAHGQASGVSGGGGCRQCGVVFPPDAQPYSHPDIPPGTPLFPVQLLSASTAFALFLLISLHFRFFRKRDGETVALLLVLYPVNRFIIEFFRFDTRGDGGLSVAQWISLFVAAGGAAWLVLLFRQPPTEPAQEGEGAPAQEPPHERPTSRSKQKRKRKGKDKLDGQDG